MRAVSLYLFQVIIASGLLYGYYHFFLRNNRFHQYNRFYLLLVPVISLVVPFLNIPLYFTTTEKDSFVLRAIFSFSSGPAESTGAPVAIIDGPGRLTWQTIFYLVYTSVVVVILMRILFSLAAVRRMIRSNPATKIGAVNFVNTEEPNTPFSFFCWMFWNKKIELNSSKGEQLFRHELFHIEQKHSHDVLYMELLAAIGWINPFFHLIRKELKATHEFLADQFAIRENEKWQYAELLLMQVFQTHQPLVNPFFNTQIKRRIAMITNSTKPNYQYLRKLMVLPVTALVIFLFAFSYREKSKTVLKKNEPRLTVQQPVTDTGTKPCPDTLALLRSDTKKAGLRETVPLKLKQLEVLTERVPLKLKQQETLIEIVSLKLKQQEPLMELELVPLKLKQQEPLRESVPLKLKQQKPLMELELVPLKLKEQVVNDTGTIPDRSTFRLLSRVEQKS